MRCINQSFYGYCMWGPVIVIYTSQQQKLAKTRQWWITATRRRCACRAVLYWVSYLSCTMVSEALGLVILILEVQVDWEYELWLYFTVTTPFKLYILRTSFQECIQSCRWTSVGITLTFPLRTRAILQSRLPVLWSRGRCNVQKTLCMWWLNVVCMETIQHWWHCKHCSYEMIALHY